MAATLNLANYGAGVYGTAKYGQYNVKPSGIAALTNLDARPSNDMRFVAFSDQIVRAIYAGTKVYVDGSLQATLASVGDTTTVSIGNQSGNTRPSKIITADYPVSIAGNGNSLAAAPFSWSGTRFSFRDTRTNNSEIIVQAFANDAQINSLNKQNQKTCFSMVRFGNVLSSSGSAVPLFIKQISSGGPVTLTHPHITRYFMTIKEASQLVIQSSAMAQGGEVFLLDMGKSVCIKDLVIKLIKLSGLQLKDDLNPHGDIEIKITGLRPGEKLYEELLIDAKAEKTDHHLIFRAKEKFIVLDEIIPKLEHLKKMIEQRNKYQTFKRLNELVKEWENQNVLN